MFGTSRMTISAARVMIGIIMIVIAKDAARPLRSKPNDTTHRLRTNRPATIDGSAVIASTRVRTTRDIRPPTSAM